MIQVFTDHHPGQQTHRRPTAIDHRRRNRCRRDGFAGAAGVLRTNRAVDEALGRLDIPLFADVLADFDPIPATLAAVAGIGFVTMFDARQLRG